MDARVVVVGGGLSGLTTAYGLMKEGIDVLVLEADGIAGGCIKTDRKNGFMVERGPNSMLVNRQQVLDFLDELGLSGEMEAANKDAEKRFIVKGGRLNPLPSSLFSFIGTPLFSAGDKLRLFKEPFIGKGDENETIAQFVRRRLGDGFYDYAINPFVSGVYAGDPEKLLARAAVRKVWVLEERHGSMIRGAVSMMLGRDKPEGRIKGRLLSFKNGMSSLPLGIAKKLGDRVVSGFPVERIEQSSKGWTIHGGDRSYSCEHVVLATPAAVVGKLLKPFSESAAQALQDIPYAPVAVAHFSFKRSQVTHPMDGFGCLIPRKEQITTLGALFSTTLFDARSPNGDDTLITCFIGGATLPEIRSWSDEQVSAKVLGDITPLLGLKGDPGFMNVVRWNQAIPQYTLGHFERIAAVDQLLDGLNGLTVRSNWRDGISVPDCILNSRAHAQQLSQTLKA